MASYLMGKTVRLPLTHSHGCGGLPGSLGPLAGIDAVIRDVANGGAVSWRQVSGDTFLEGVAKLGSPGIGRTPLVSLRLATSSL